jgi:hypothetical protein
MGSALRVVVVSASAELWGAEKTLLELSGAVDPLRFELSFVVALGSPLAPPLRRMGFEVREHRFAGHPALAGAGSLSGAGIGAIARELVSNVTGGIRLAQVTRGFDAILSFSIWQAVESVIAARLTRSKFFLDIHETFTGSKGHVVLRALARIADGVIAPSHYVVERSEIHDHGRVAVVPRPVTRRAMPPARTANGMLKLGMFGQISAHKGVAAVVSIIAEMGSTAAQLVVVGGRPLDDQSQYERDVRQAVRELGDRALLVDAVDNVASLMSSCDLVV